MSERALFVLVLSPFSSSLTSTVSLALLPVLAIFQNESGDMDTEQSYLFDAEPVDETIGESAIFTIVSRARRTSELETSLSLS